MSNLTPDTLPTPAARRPLTPVEALGGTLYVRPMSVRDWKGLPDGDEALAVHIVARSTVYADGSLVWPEGDAVVDYTAEDLKPLIVAAMQVNGLTKGALEDRKGN